MRDSNHDLPLDNTNQTLLESYKKHKKLEKQVESFGRYATYSASAALKLKELKKQKLLEMDKMMRAKN